MKRGVDISILEPFSGEVSRAWLRKVATRALDTAMAGDGPCQVGVVIADDGTVRRLNREYRGLDEVTDVLAFSPSHQGSWEGTGAGPVHVDGGVPFVMPPEDPQHLGEVIISYPQAVRQAGPGPSGLDRELALLVAHGVLHLVGLDHTEPSEEADMHAKEREILSFIFP